MKKVTFIIASLLFSLNGLAQTGTETTKQTRLELTDLHEEVFIAERKISTDRIDRTIERLKMSYEDLIDMKIDPETMEVKVLFRSTISEESRTQIINYFNF